MVRFDIKPTKSTAYEHTNNVYGAMCDDTDKHLESVMFDTSSITEWNVDSLTKMVQFVKECAIIIDCDDGRLAVQRYNDGNVSIDCTTSWYAVKLMKEVIE